MHRVADGLRQKRVDYKTNPQAGAALIAFRLGFEYFITSRDALMKDLVISGGACLRTGLENVIDLLYVYSNPGKYTEPYVLSMSKFDEVMRQAAVKDFSEVIKSRELKQANKWTGASIEDRLMASGDSLTTVYDLLSYFGHPNPGALNWTTSPGRLQGQLNLLKQSNCMNAFVLMAMVQNFSDSDEVSFEEINLLAQKIGFSFEFDEHGNLQL